MPIPAPPVSVDPLELKTPRNNLSLAEQAHPTFPAKGSDSGASGTPLRWLLTTQPRAYRLTSYVVVAVLVALFVLLASQGTSLQVVYGHDMPGFLESAWRVRNGVLPHADYHSAIGALNPWILAAGMWTLGPTAAVLPFCITLVGVILGLLAWSVASRRLPAVPAAIFALTQAVVAMATAPLRCLWYDQGYASYYNRQSYALLSILLLGLFLPSRQSADPAKAARRDGWTLGGILGVLFFLKISYFVAGGALCAVAFLFGRRLSRPLLTGVLLGFGLVAAACLPLIRFDVLAMLRDLRLASAARSENIYFPISFGSWLANLPTLWIEAALLATAQMLLRPRAIFRQRDPSPGEAPTWLEFAAVAAVEGFILMTNMWSPHGDAPLLTSWFFVLIGAAQNRAITKEADLSTRTPITAHLPVLYCLAGILWIFSFGNAALSVAWSALPWQTDWKKFELAQAPLFDSDSLADLRIVQSGRVRPPLPVSYAEKVNDGLQALRRLGGVHRVECVDFNNPFPFALQWPTAHGGMWCWHNNFSFSQNHHPAPAEAFGDADVLMVPIFPGELDSFPVMAQVYGPYIQTHFHPVARTAQWVVMRQN